MNKILILLIVLVILAVILMVLFGWKGLGFGKAGEGGRDDGNDNGSAVTVQADGGDTDEKAQAEAAAVSVKERMVEYADVTVTGNSYLWEGGVIGLEELREKLRNTDSVVRITDSGATQNAMEDLIAALEQDKKDHIFADEESSE